MSLQKRFTSPQVTRITTGTHHSNEEDKTMLKQLRKSSNCYKPVSKLMLVVVFAITICITPTTPTQAALPPWFDKQPTAACRAASRFAVNNTANNANFVSGIPTFEYLENGNNTKWGVIQIPSSIAFTKDVPQAELGEVTNFRSLLRAANRYAKAQGYGAGYPTCETIIVNGKRVWGVVFIRKEAIQIDLVTAAQLARWTGLNIHGYGWSDFRAANRYADLFKKVGFATGFPTGEWEEMTNSQGAKETKYEIVKFKLNTIVWQDAVLGITPDECGECVPID
jgi:hypothetical protein